MNNASISLIRRFSFHKFRPNPLLLLLRPNYISDAPSASSLVSPTREFSTCCRTYGLVVEKNHFLEKSSRIVCTLVEESSMQMRIKEKSDLEEAFEAAETTDERISLFNEMESSSFERNELGLSALVLGIHLYREGKDPEKVLYYASKALKSFDVDDDNKPSLLVAMALQLMGTASYGLNRLSHSVRYLHRASQILVKLEAERDENGVEDVRRVLQTVKIVLENVYYAMGEQEEAIEDSLNSLETKEMTLEEDSKELGVANRSVADAFTASLNYESALPYALEALEIHRKELGNNLAEVAQDRRLLSVIYSGLEQHDKAMEQKQLSQRVLKNWGTNLEILRAEIDPANMEIALGKYEEAISKGVVKRTKKDSETRAMVLISMSKALVNQHKFADSKRCLEFSCGILEKKEKASPVEVVEAYSEIALQYESMNEFETAVLLLKKTLCILERLSEEQHSRGSVFARIGWLLLLSGKASQAILYLESAAERLKESFGDKHFRVGYVYNNLGAAYIELEKPQSAAEMFAIAKDIMYVSLGLNKTCQNLYEPYATMGKFAMEFQQLLIGNWDKHGDSTKDELKEVKRFLEELRFKALGKERPSLCPRQSHSQ